MTWGQVCAVLEGPHTRVVNNAHKPVTEADYHLTALVPPATAFAYARAIGGRLPTVMEAYLFNKDRGLEELQSTGLLGELTTTPGASGNTTCLQYMDWEATPVMKWTSFTLNIGFQTVRGFRVVFPVTD